MVAVERIAIKRFKIIHINPKEIASYMINAGGGIISSADVLHEVISLGKKHGHRLEFYSEKNGMIKYLSAKEIKNSYEDIPRSQKNNKTT